MSERRERVAGPANELTPLEYHLIEEHGVEYCWDSAGPCSPSPVGVHNQMHWDMNRPDHTHPVRPGMLGPIDFVPVVREGGEQHG
jgi:hypothetical protein